MVSGAMTLPPEVPDDLDREVIRLFALVAEAIARATESLLADNVDLAREVIDGDELIDELVATTEGRVWDRFAGLPTAPDDWRYLVMVLLILPELERSADLAEHVAQRALNRVGLEMSPVSRGVVARMGEAAIEMWRAVADGYADRHIQEDMAEDDEELDILHDRITSEVITESMSVSIGAQVTLVARFYERLGDHAVNLARRIASLPRGGAVG
jgi:phosphate transport system protein